MTGPWQTFQSHFDRLFAALNAPERSARGLNFGRTLAPRAAFELMDVLGEDVNSCLAVAKLTFRTNLNQPRVGQFFQVMRNRRL